MNLSYRVSVRTVFDGLAIALVNTELRQMNSIKTDDLSGYQKATGRIEQVKIYGERNTGTRFLHELIQRNFEVRLLSPEAASREHADLIRTELGGKLPSGLQGRLIRRIILNRLHDLENNRKVAATLGWKHTRPPVEVIVQQCLTASILFLVVVKHPVFWALSFHRKPYHDYLRLRKMSFAEFIRHMFIPTDRDNVDPLFFKSPLELYAAKVDGYRQLASLGVPFELVRYEELLSDVSGFVQALSMKHGLPRKSADVFVPPSSTKGDERTLGDFRFIYSLDDVNQAVSREDYEFIVSAFGAERLRWLGYSVA